MNAHITVQCRHGEVVTTLLDNIAVWTCTSAYDGEVNYQMSAGAYRIYSLDRHEYLIVLEKLRLYGTGDAI